MADPARPSAATLASGELLLRVLSALVLAPVALAVAFFGGWGFALFWLIASIIVLAEWMTLVAAEDRRGTIMAGGAALVIALGLAGSAASAPQGMGHTRLLTSIIIIAMGALAAAAFASAPRRGWIAAGVPYAGAIGLSAVLLRSDSEWGFVAIVFLFAVVWITDIAAYFIGRAVGGPKLVPQISPNKTWSGAIGGALGAVIAAVLLARLSGLASGVALAVVAASLSAVAQAGDVFESFIKRRFGVKDSGHLIPGHGGLMDRLDGFVAAAMVAALIGLARGGLSAPAQGLLLW
jgi:phosphatidate cytidylyltransferase